MSGGPNPVLLFAEDDDPHAVVVREHLACLGATSISVSFASVLEKRFVVHPGAAVAFDDVVVDGHWTVWWRRTGEFPSEPGMSGAEQRLRADETAALLVGGLVSLGGRWVDEPHVVARAEHTLLQLATARVVGAETPTTVATNVPSVAQKLMAGGPCVAKVTSSGVGLAPHVDNLTEDLIPLLPAAPTLLQHRLEAHADLRVIVVGREAKIWARPRRTGSPVDWRASDAWGEGFARIADPGVGSMAVAINDRLGLTFSAQDWLLVDEEPWFLEANPSGQWLFLDGADTSVGSALAGHLAGTLSS